MIARNVGFSLLSFLANLILAFFVSPMILHNLGDTRYGVWALFGEVLSYYSLLDFGIRGAINYFVGKTLAQQDEAGVRRYVSSGFFGLLGLAVTAFAATVLLILAFQDVFVRDGVNRIEIVSSACLFVGIFCASLPLETFAAVLVGSRRAYLVSRAELVSRLISTALIAAALMIAPNMVLLAMAQLIGRLYYWSAISRLMRQHVPEAAVSIRDAGLEPMRNLVRYGGKSAVIEMSGVLAGRKDVTLLSIFIGPQWAATFTFARMAVESLSQACGSITMPVRPNVIYHWARKEYDEAYTLVYVFTRYSSFVLLMVAAFLVPFGSDFLRLWIGARFVTGDIWFRADVVLFLLLATHLLRMVFHMSRQLLFAQHRHTFLTYLTAADAVVNTALAVALVRPYGSVGLAVAALVPTLVSYGVVYPLLLRRIAGISLRRFFREGLGRPLAGAICVVAAGFLVRHWIPVHGWREFFLNGAILAIPALVFGALAVLEPSDRQRMLAVFAALRARAHKKASA